MPKLLITPYQWLSYICKRRVRILMYHSISNDKGDPLSVPPTMFRQQMQCLSEHGFRVASLGEIVKILKKHERIPSKLVCLTFDDGYKDFLEHAMPVLAEYGFGATLFVVAGAVGSVSYWSSYRKDRPLLDWGDLKEVTASGCEIGSHSMTHPDLTALPLSDLDEEVTCSKQILEDNLQVRIHHFAYPGGTFTQREIDAVRKAGYEAAVVVGGRWANGYDTPLHRLHREKVERSDTIESFWHKVNGYYEIHWVWRKVMSWRTK